MKVAIDKALPLIMEKEGFRSTPYKCSANHWTIGYGTLMVDMPKGTKSITEPEARKRLRARVERDWKQLRGAVDVELNVNQAAALLSLVYNIGIGAFSGSTLRRKLNAGDYTGAAKEFMKWNKETVKGKKVRSQGLENRRLVERDLFLTPAASLEKAAVQNSRTVKAAATLGAVTTSVGIEQTADAIQAVSPAIPLAERILDIAPYAALIVIGVGIAGYIIYCRIQDAKAGRR